MANTFHASVAAEVRAEMGRQRVTQEQMAALLGRSREWVRRRTHGDQPFSTDEIEQIAGVLGVPISNFVTPAT